MISGLRLNNKKTEVLWIGACAGSQDKICPERDLKWVKDKVKALGVWISTDPSISMKANYSEKLLLFKNNMMLWAKGERKSPKVVRMRVAREFSSTLIIPG